MLLLFYRRCEQRDAVRHAIADPQVADVPYALADGEADRRRTDQYQQSQQVTGVPRQLTEAVFQKSVDHQRCDHGDHRKRPVVQRGRGERRDRDGDDAETPPRVGCRDHRGDHAGDKHRSRADTDSDSRGCRRAVGCVRPAVSSD